jgi:hypothetical protein
MKESENHTYKFLVAPQANPYFKQKQCFSGILSTEKIWVITADGTVMP